MIDLTVIILTFNEERHIERAIRSLGGLATDIFVVDSFSTDSTAATAERLGAKVLRNRFVNQAKQFQWALDNAPVRTGWIMRLDADETLEPELVGEIRATLSNLPPDVVGVNLRRRHIFMGRWIQHGGRYPLILLRIFRRGFGSVEDRWMDEHLTVRDGKTVTFTQDFSDINLGDLASFTGKHNDYATREAIDVLDRKYGLGLSRERSLPETAPRQAVARRFVKERIYSKAPLWLGPAGYFFYRYILRLGFLDGREGLVYHVLQGFWYRFLVGARILEFEKRLASISGAQDKVAALEGLTGRALSDREHEPRAADEAIERVRFAFGRLRTSP